MSITEEHDRVWLRMLQEATPGERLTPDSPPQVRDRHRDRYRRAIGLAGERVGGVWWDVACGDGYGTAMLPTRNRVGFDRHLLSIERAKESVPRARFWCEDLTDKGWWLREPSRPNIVLSIETLEHLGTDLQRKFVADIATVLRPAGMLVLACPLGDGPNPANQWHVHEPSEDHLRALLGTFFPRVDIATEEYVSTSGPAVQAWCCCYAH